MGTYINIYIYVYRGCMGLYRVGIGQGNRVAVREVSLLVISLTSEWCSGEVFWFV